MSGAGHRFVRRGASVVVVWAGLNAILAGVLFIFTSPSMTQQLAFYWAAVGILLLVALAVFAVPRRPVDAARGQAQPHNGAPAAAFAAACFIGGMAWVFGLFVAYLALPLIAFCLARWRVEWRLRRQAKA